LRISKRLAGNALALIFSGVLGSIFIVGMFVAMAVTGVVV